MKNFNIQKYLCTHDIIFQQPPEIWQEGLIIGNGDMVSVSFVDRTSLCWGIDKVDLYDSRVYINPKRGQQHSGILKALENRDREQLYKIFVEGQQPTCNYPYPHPKACGLLRIGCDGVDFYRLEKNQFEQRTKIGQGINTIVLTTDSINLHCESFIKCDQNLLVINVKGRCNKTVSLNINFERWIDPVIGEPKLSKGKGFGQFQVLHRINNMDGYAVTGRIINISGKEKVTSNCYDLKVNLEKGNFEFQVYLAVEKQDSDKLQTRSVNQQLNKDIDLGYKKLRSKHVQCWKKFWNKSYLFNSDKFFEQIYYAALYHTACFTGTSTLPAPNRSPGILHDYSSWALFACDINVEQVHWPLYTSNHTELLKPLIEFLPGNLKKICRETKKYYGIDGASIGFELNANGLPAGDPWYRHMHQCGGWLAELLWWCYEFTQDKKLLAENLYPFIKQVAVFYLNYITEDSQGKLSAYPSVPPEQLGPDGRPIYIRNDAASRSTIYAALNAAAESADILNLDRAFAEKCRKTIEKLADYPNNGKVILDHEGARADQPLNHPSLLNGVFSTGEINKYGDKKLFNMAKRTYKNIYNNSFRNPNNDYNPWKIPLWVDDLSYPWLACIAARLGLADDAWATIYDQITLLQLRENGTHSGEPPMFPQRNRKTYWSNSNHETGIAAGIIEMYIQSHAGIIEVFPAVPVKYDCGFKNLLARGAFEVTSQRRNGKVDFIQLKSLAGKRARLLNPWIGSKVSVLKSSKKIASFLPDTKFIEFKTSRNGTYIIVPAQKKSANLTYPRYAERLSRPRLYNGPKFLGNRKLSYRESVSIGKIYSDKLVHSLKAGGEDSNFRK